MISGKLKKLKRQFSPKKHVPVGQPEAQSLSSENSDESCDEVSMEEDFYDKEEESPYEPSEHSDSEPESETDEPQM